MTLLAQSTTPSGLADIREPVDIFVMPWLVVGIVAVVLLTAFLFWRWWDKRSKIVKLPPPEPPLHRARRLLADLRTAAAALEDKALCVGASDIVRQFIEEAFKLPAGERTTEEFLPEVQTDPRFETSMRDGLAGFLTQVDMVKFAAQGLSGDQRAELLDSVSGFLDAAGEALAKRIDASEAHGRDAGPQHPPQRPVAERPAPSDAEDFRPKASVADNTSLEDNPSGGGHSGTNVPSKASIPEQGGRA